MRAIILAGGYGSRLAPLTLRLPKVLVPVAGEPPIVHQVKMLKNAGVTNVVVSLNHNQQAIEKRLGNGSAYGVRISYAYEKSFSDADKPGAIGALNNLVGELGAEDSIILGGDNTVYGLDLKKMLAAHKKSKKAEATLALYQLENKRLVQLYGIAVIDPKGRITGFQEKPSPEAAKSTLASTAVYIVSGAFLGKRIPAYVAAGHSRDRIGDLWQHYVSKAKIHGFPFQGVWGDTNSPESYVEINKKAMNYLEKGAVHPSARIHPKALVRQPSFIGQDCVISEGAVVGPYACLGAGCKIGAGAVVDGSILFNSVSVEAKARVTDAVVDEGCNIGEEAIIERYSMLGKSSKVGTRARVVGGSKVWPGVRLAAEAFLEGEVST